MTLALCIALLSVFGVVNIKVVSATTLAVLALLAVSGLATRHQSEEAGRRIELYQHQTIEQNPSFTLRADRDSHWYQLFTRQFDTIWESAQPYRLTAPE